MTQALEKKNRNGGNLNGHEDYLQAQHKEVEKDRAFGARFVYMFLPEFLRVTVFVLVEKIPEERHL